MRRAPRRRTLSVRPCYTGVRKRLFLCAALLSALPACAPERVRPGVPSELAWRESYLGSGSYLGVTGEARDLDGRTAIVLTAITPGGAADRAHLQKDDRILSIDGSRRFLSQPDFALAVYQLDFRTPHVFEIRRGGETLTLDIQPDPAGKRGDVLEGRVRREQLVREVADALRGGIIEDHRGRDWDALVMRYTPLAEEARTRWELYGIINRMLGELKVSHLVHLSPEFMRCEWPSFTADVYTAGVEMVLRDDRFLVARLFEGSSAGRAGLCVGDEIISVDGLPPREAPACRSTMYHAGMEPPFYFLYLRAGESVSLRVRGSADPADERTVALALDGPGGYLHASRASRDILETDRHKLAYLHLWCLLSGDYYDLWRDFLAREGNEADAVLLDLRGRGGDAGLAVRITRDIAGIGKPVVVLVDGMTYSAKELIAYRVKKEGTARVVGQTTLGAFIGLRMIELSDGSVLEYPAHHVEGFTDGAVLEGHGVEPDVPVEYDLACLGGRDPILEAAKIEAVRLIAGREPARRD